MYRVHGAVLKVEGEQVDAAGVAGVLEVVAAVRPYGDVAPRTAVQHSVVQRCPEISDH